MMDFLDAKKNSYRYMGGYNAGLTAFTTAITVVVMLSGGVMIARGKGNITDLITFCCISMSLRSQLRH